MQIDGFLSTFLLYVALFGILGFLAIATGVMIGHVSYMSRLMPWEESAPTRGMILRIHRGRDMNERLGPLIVRRARPDILVIVTLGKRTIKSLYFRSDIGERYRLLGFIPVNRPNSFHKGDIVDLRYCGRRIVEINPVEPSDTPKLSCVAL